MITEIALTTIKDQFETIFEGIWRAASTSFNSVLSSAQSGLAGVIGTAQQAIVQMSTLAATAQTQAKAALKGYNVGVVSEVLAKEGYWKPAQPFNLTGASLQAYADMLAQAVHQTKFGTTGPANMTATLPVNMIIDGTTVSRIVEQRMISQRQLAGR